MKKTKMKVTKTTPKLSKTGIEDAEKASYQASLASTYCLQAGLEDFAVKLTGISAALSRIVLENREP